MSSLYPVFDSHLCPSWRNYATILESSSGKPLLHLLVVFPEAEHRDYSSRVHHLKQLR